MEIDLSRYPFSPPRKGKVVVTFRDMIGAALTLVYDPAVSGAGFCDIRMSSCLLLGV